MLPTHNVNSATVLAGIPAGLRDPLLEAFHSIVRNFREGRWEPAELNGGKLSEIVYTILRGYVDGAFATSPSKPSNMVQACQAFEQADRNRFSRSVRIQIPRMLMALYEVRNNRGVGHVGGDVNPNHMDSVVVLYMAKWIMAELVRIFHNVTTTTATQIVDALVDRTIPIIWEVGQNRRVLNPKLSMKDRTLALLYGCAGPVSEAELYRWVEHSNSAVFRRDILVKAHKAKLIEYDRQSKLIHISPTGMQYVEKMIPLEI